MNAEVKMAWGPSWKDKLGRFESENGGTPSLEWRWAYWFGRERDQALTAAGFLGERGEQCEFCFDATMGWLILTDYDDDEEG